MAFQLTWIYSDTSRRINQLNLYSASEEHIIDIIVPLNVFQCLLEKLHLGMIIRLLSVVLKMLHVTVVNYVTGLLAFHTILAVLTLQHLCTYIINNKVIKQYLQVTSTYFPVRIPHS